MLIYGLPDNISLLITVTLIERDFISSHSVEKNIPVHYTFQFKHMYLKGTYNHKRNG
jgi:hypothetical protein